MFETVPYLDTFFSSMINLNKELEMASVKKKNINFVLSKFKNDFFRQYQFNNFLNMNIFMFE